MTADRLNYTQQSVMYDELIDSELVRERFLSVESFTPPLYNTKH